MIQQLLQGLVGTFAQAAQPLPPPRELWGPPLHNVDMCGWDGSQTKFRKYKSDVARSPQGKADLSDIQNQLERKCSLNDFREGLATKADLGSMKRALENCVTREKIAQLENSIRVLSTNVIMRRGKAAGGGDGGVDDLEELKNDLMKHIKQKCDIKHTTHALESKINKHDFDRGEKARHRRVDPLH